MNVPGFCKAASLEEIRSHGHVLTPGRYVGAAAAEEDDVPFVERFTALNSFMRLTPMSESLSLEDLSMLHTIEVEIDANGRVHPVEPFEHLTSGRALLTFLTSVEQVAESALLAEPALAEDWLKPEEDEAWAHLQPDRP